MVEDPLLRAELADLAGTVDLAERPDPAAAALAALACVRALNRLGLGFGRVDAPSWMRPLLDWFAAGADRSSFESALTACVPTEDVGSPRSATGCLTIAADFDLPATVARIWLLGAVPDWQVYYGAEERGRRPLPTYPFNRQRHWLERVVRGSATTTAVRTSAAAPDLDVVATVAEVWRSVLGLDAIDHDAHFVDDLDGDSMYAVEIGARLGELFPVDVPIDLPFVAPTVASSAKLVEEALARAAASGEPDV